MKSRKMEIEISECNSLKLLIRNKKVKIIKLLFLPINIGEQAVYGSYPSLIQCRRCKNKDLECISWSIDHHFNF